MFKSATLFQLKSSSDINAVQLDAKLQGKTFEPCGPTQEVTWGWMPPRGENNGALIEAIGGQWVMSLQVQTKKVPGHAVAALVEEKMAKHQASTGRPAGRKEKKEMTEEARIDLMPSAFAKTSTVFVWVCLDKGWLVISSASRSQCDLIASDLIASWEGLTLTPLNTAVSPASGMAQWLTTLEWPLDMAGDNECELRAVDSSKAKVRYDNHQVEIAEIRQHIEGGKLPTKLGISLHGKVSMVLSDKLTFKKITLLDVSTEISATHGGSSDAFDANVVLTTGQLIPAFEAVIAGLGGVAPTAATASTEAASPAKAESKEEAMA